MKYLLLLAGIIGLVSVGAQTAAAGPAPTCAPSVSAHRGDSSHHVQGTLRSYAGAYADGAELLDGDVRFTKSDVPMIMHDATLTAFGSKKAIADASYSYVKSLSAPDGSHPMSLWDYVAMIKAFPDARAELELKVMPDALGWTRVERKLAPIETRTRLSSFKTRVVNAERKRGYRTGIITNGWLPTPTEVKGFGGMLYLNYRLMTDTYVQSMQKAGDQVTVWTVDDPTQWATLPAGVTVLTDDPGDYISWYDQNVCGEPAT